MSKPDVTVQGGRPGLVRAVGFWGLVAMCINAVVGSGVFLLPSETFRILGPFSLWAPLLFALPVFILVLCFAEAASHFDEPGGAYLYTRTAFGDFLGFETGWMNWLARISSLAALTNGLILALGRVWPAALETGPRAALILGTIGALAAVHIIGIKYGAATIYFLTAAKLFPLLLFVAVALFLLPSNPIPASMALPGRETNWGEAALFMLFAYAGFENLGVPAGEYRNPRRHLPVALLVGVLAIATVYALTQFASMAALPNLEGTGTPVADAAGVVLGPFGIWLITIGAMISMLGTNSGTMLEGSRMLYAISRGRRFFNGVGSVHSRFHTPVTAIVIHALAATVLALGGTFAKLAVLSAVARLATYLFTCLAVPRLRRLSEGFRTPGLWIPILGSLISLLIVVTLRREHLLAAVLALAVGALLWVLGRQGRGSANIAEERAE